MAFWTDKRVVVTGGHGFIGSALSRALIAAGVPESHLGRPRSESDNLLDPEAAKRVVAGAEIVFHLAPATGGIAFSRAYPGTQFATCTRIDLNVFEACAAAGVGKLVLISNLLTYPPTAPSPLQEEALFTGALASTHLGIGAAKRNLVLLSQMFAAEKGLSSVVAVAANAFGPGDRFDPRHSHVIPSLIHKCRTQSQLDVWGTGREVRDFLYVDDLAEGLLITAEHLSAGEYINLGSGRGTSVRELVETIADLTGFAGPIVYDASKSGGDLVRIADTSRCTARLGFSPRTTLRTGLAATIAAYDAALVPSGGAA